jgi:hypothetical protein
LATLADVNGRGRFQEPWRGTQCGVAAETYLFTSGSRYPITISFAKRVGQLMSEIPENQTGA